MRVEQEQVRLFHEKHDIARREAPGVPDVQTVRDRIRIMGEEWKELCDALEAGDLEKIADGGADLVYTVLGTMVACGIELEPIFAEVHASNMTKGPLNADKKGGKGPDFKKPRIAELLLLQLGIGEAAGRENVRPFRTFDDVGRAARPTRSERLQELADRGTDTWEEYRGER